MADGRGGRAECVTCARGASPEIPRPLKRLLDSPGALVAAWFVAAGLVAGLAAFAFLQPPPPAGGEAVSVPLPAEAILEEQEAAPEETDPEGADTEEAPADAVTPPEGPTEGEPAMPAAEPPGQIPQDPPVAPPSPAEPPVQPPQGPPEAPPAESSPPEAAVPPQAAAPAPPSPAPSPPGDEDAAPAQETPVDIPVIPPAPEQLAYWERYRQPFNAQDTRPRVAVVLTGLGLSDSATEAAIEELPAAVTLSFSPYARNLERWIALARARGHEVMIDLPMEPTTFPNEDPGPQALLTSLAPQDNLDRLDWVLARASAYVGLAGSMGSRFTASREAVEPILREVKERGLMFLDRRTTEESLVAVLAEEIGLPYAINNRSIDERQASRVAIDARLAQIERIALTDGYAVAMAQPYPVTLDRLSEWTGELTARGFAIAPISALANQQEAP